MSDDYEDGKECARAFWVRFKQFRKESLTIVIDDMRKRRIGRRRHRTDRKGKIAFVLAIISLLRKGAECQFTLETYASLAGVEKGKFATFANRNPAFAREVLGEEWDRTIRRRPLKDEKSGQIILDRKEKIPGTKEDYRHGPAAFRIHYVFRDYEVKDRLRTNADFRRGFFESFCEEFLCELLMPASCEGEIGTPLERMAKEMSNIRFEHLEATFKPWSQLLKTTRKGIQELREVGIPSKCEERFISNCDHAIQMLTRLREDTQNDIVTVRRDGGTLVSPLLRVLEPVLSCEDWEDDMVLQFLEEHREELYEASMKFLRIAIMVYYSGPMARTEWEKYTNFSCEE